ncbi:MAG: hypothetical protein ACO28Q_08130 [Ilumatobacteraceae bacterium]
MRVRSAVDTIAGSLAALGALAIALVQLRDGVVPILDTVTYWSGTEDLTRGHLFSTTLAPAFSNFDAIEFLNRGGRLPFVDFPIGYPLAAGLVGVVIGSSAAMAAFTVTAVVALVVLVVRGGATASGAGPAPVRAATLVVVAIGIVSLPTTRLVTHGALSEPLFAAVVVGLVLALASYRTTGRWWPVATLVIVASLLRFIGGPLAILAGWERYRRTRRAGESVVWSIALMVPALVNIVLAAAAGGGHDAGWRGVERLDLELFVRSIGGWFDSSQGDLTRTYFVDRSPDWWSWPLAVLWVGALVHASIGVVRRRSRLNAVAELALAAAAIITAGLVLGFLGFDALVVPDNRLMLPAGILTICALVWSVPNTKRWAATSLVVAAVWFAVATAPSGFGEPFTEPSRTYPYGAMIAGFDADALVSNDADGMHWATGIPAVYAPTPVKQLTGERVDTAPLYAALPCALDRANGIVVIVDTAEFSNADRDALDAEVEAGRLEVTSRPGGTIYSPGAGACD